MSVTDLNSSEKVEDVQSLFSKYKEDLTAQQRNVRKYPRPIYREQSSIPERIKNQKAELENQAIAQDIALKKLTLLILFIFLAVETVVIFATAFFQGFKFYGFSLEEWSFRLMVSATITQITIMLLVAVKHLFPRK